MEVVTLFAEPPRAAAGSALLETAWHVAENDLSNVRAISGLVGYPAEVKDAERREIGGVRSLSFVEPGLEVRHNRNSPRSG